MGSRYIYRPDARNTPLRLERSTDSGRGRRDPIFSSVVQRQADYSSDRRVLRSVIHEQRVKNAVHRLTRPTPSTIAKIGGCREGTGNLNMDWYVRFKVPVCERPNPTYFYTKHGDVRPVSNMQPPPACRDVKKNFPDSVKGTHRLQTLPQTLVYNKSCVRSAQWKDYQHKWAAQGKHFASDFAPRRPANLANYSIHRKEKVA